MGYRQREQSLSLRGVSISSSIALRRLGAQHIHTGQRCVGFEQDEHGVSVRFADPADNACPTVKDPLHNSLRSVVARARAVCGVAFFANSGAIGCKKAPCSPSRSTYHSSARVMQRVLKADIVVACADCAQRLEPPWPVRRLRRPLRRLALSLARRASPDCQCRENSRIPHGR